MGAICVIINRREGEPGNTDIVDAMLREAVAARSGNPDQKLPSPASRAFSHVAAGAIDVLNGNSGRCLHEDDTVLVVCDAEFYNGKELSGNAGVAEAAGEAALIAGLYRRHGEAWFEKAIGNYGVFIFDKAKRKGLAYSDRLGVRPLIVYEDEGRIVVASFLASLAGLPGFRPAFDHQAVYSYLFMEMIPTPFTIYRKVRKLEGGHVLRIAGGRTETARVWNMKYPEPKLADEGEMIAGMRRLMRQAVQRQAALGVESPEELGSFLSGGTDSSLIAGLLSEMNPGRAKTFTIGFEEPGYDEMEFSRIASNRFKTKADEYYVTRDDIVDALPLIVRAFDEPFANSSVIPTYFCARRARETGVRVIMGGDGGDEIFGGNSRYRDYFRDFHRFHPLVEAAMSVAVGATPKWAQVGPMRTVANYLTRKHAPLHERIHAYNLSFYFGKRENIFAPDFLAGQGEFLNAQEIARRILEGAETKDELDRYLYHDLKNTLMDNDLRKVNTMTELAGVQVRYPFLDTELIEFTGLIPSNLKVKDGALRYLYKEAFKDILPLEIINKKKHGFGLPVVQWMFREGRLNDMLRDALFDGRLKARGIFRESFVEGLYKRAQADKKAYFGTFLYYIFFLELWLREHVDGNAGHASARFSAAAAVPGSSGKDL
jgi:asparagine synthase (glutamine-hydrolysing)